MTVLPVPDQKFESPFAEARHLLVASMRSWWRAPKVWMYWVAPVLALLLYFVHVAFIGPIGKLPERALMLGNFAFANAVPLAVMAMGSGIVLATGGVDLSVAGTATLAGLIYAVLGHDGYPAWVSAPAACIAGGGAGLLLGRLVARGLPPLITSWALGIVWMTNALVLAALLPSLGIETGSITGLSLAPDARASVSVVKAVGIVAVVALLLGMTNLLRQAKAVGANRDSAEYAGVRSKDVLRFTYGVNGALAAGAGVIFALLNSTASTGDLQGKELFAIAIAVLGGTVVTGGYLNLWSIAFAAALWKLLEFSVQTMPVPYFSDLQQRVVTFSFAVAVIAVAWVFAKLEKRAFIQVLKAAIVSNQTEKRGAS